MPHLIARLRLLLVLAAFNAFAMGLAGALIWPEHFGRSDNAYLPLLGHLGGAIAGFFGNGVLWHLLSRGYRTEPVAFLLGGFVWCSVGPFFVAHGIEAAVSPIGEARDPDALRQQVDAGVRTFTLPGCAPDRQAIRRGRAEVPRTLYEPDHALGPRTERAVVAPLRCADDDPDLVPTLWVGAGRVSDLDLWHTEGIEAHYRVIARTPRALAYANALALAPAPRDPIVLESALAPMISAGLLRGLAGGWAITFLALAGWCTRPWTPSAAEQPAVAIRTAPR